MSGKLSCFIAAFVLAIMIIAVLLNSIYIKNTADHILYLADSAGGGSDAKIRALSQIYEYLNERISVLKLSLSEKELDEIALAIDDAKISIAKQDEEEYKRAMARLRRAIEGIKKREEFSLENIF